ncbi:MAG: TlpA family protein disulfide reductase [Bacteroidales bacterium]|nr:TlpA family protein disulfide reductase [Bacteroidales bacterium]
MKKILLFFVASIFLFTSCNETPEGLVEKISGESKKHKSVNYKVTEKSYYSNRPDTTITPFEVWLIRDSNDSLRNGYVWVDNNYRPYNMIYDEGSLYLAIPPKKTTILYSDFEEALISEVDWIDLFLNPDILTTQVDDPAINTFISDTVYDGKTCTKLIIKFPAGQTGEMKNYTYVLDESNLFPLWAKLESNNSDHVYVEELYFFNYAFDNIDLAELKERQKKVLLENPVERDGNNSEVSRLESMLHIGDKAPLFDGNYYSTGENFKLADYIGKNIIIVDFWYTHCPPCVKAMPALSDLNAKYKDQGLKIFGFNSVDNQPRSLDNLDKFLGKRDLSYDVILIKPSVDISYKINGYPTMYVIDKEGKIAFVEVGFDEGKFSSLTEKIEGLLR